MLSGNPKVWRVADARINLEQLVPFITVNARHIQNMTELVMTVTKSKAASYLLFKTMPDLISVEHTIDPANGILAEPLLRACRSPFDILQELHSAYAHATSNTRRSFHPLGLLQRGREEPSSSTANGE